MVWTFLATLKPVNLAETIIVTLHYSNTRTRNTQAKQCTAHCSTYRDLLQLSAFNRNSEELFYVLN